jgi:hypothetical protein
MQISPEEEDGVDDRKFISIICICADKIGKTLIDFYFHSLIIFYFIAVTLIRIICLDHHTVGFDLIKIGNGRKMKLVF